MKAKLLFFFFEIDLVSNAFFPISIPMNSSVHCPRYAEAHKTAWKDFAAWCLIPTQNVRTLVSLAHASSVVNLSSYFRSANSRAGGGNVQTTQSNNANGSQSAPDDNEMLGQIMIDLGMSFIHSFFPSFFLSFFLSFVASPLFCFLFC
jgi:hypothetical protein